MGLAERGLLGLAALGLGAKALLFAHAGYSLGLFALGRIVGQRTPAQSPATPMIAALIVAHDEAAVIQECVRSLRAQNYPPERFVVCVVADNCRDQTAALARAAGATVLERCSGAPSGKPAAVDWALTELFRICQPDAIAVFDADNVVDPEFFAAVGGRLGSGERVVQGAVDAKNPDDSFVAALSAVGFFAIDVLSQEPRERLGLSAALMGTGWAATSQVLERHLRDARTVTDDLEAGAALAMAGIRVAYEPRARLLDEKPTSLGAALGQRERWMRGRFAVAGARLGDLLKAAISGGPTKLGPKERLRAFDVGVQLAGPSLAFSSAALGALTALELAARPFLPRPARTLLGALPARAALAVTLAGSLAPLGSLLWRGASWRMCAAHVFGPAYLLLSVPLAARGFRDRKRADWQPTRHGGAARAKPQTARA